MCNRILVPGSRSLGDRKSTRLNSSHSQISYAVFCLKKKKKKCQIYPVRMQDGLGQAFTPYFQHLLHLTPETELIDLGNDKLPAGAASLDPHNLHEDSVARH